jgi:hypothetical protein
MPEPWLTTITPPGASSGWRDRMIIRGHGRPVCQLVNTVMIVGKSGASSGKDADVGVPGSTLRTKTPPGASSGWRDRMIIRGLVD